MMINEYMCRENGYNARDTKRCAASQPRDEVRVAFAI